MNLLLNSDNDIQVIDGNIPLAKGIDQVEQAVGLHLKAFAGDWFLNFDLGIPYFQTIFKKGVTLSQVEALYIDTILSVPAVLDLQTFNISFDAATRKLSIDFSALTTNGLLNYSTEV